MKEKFDAYVLWLLAKKFQNWIVDRSTARDFTVANFEFYNSLVFLLSNMKKYRPMEKMVVKIRIKIERTVISFQSLTYNLEMNSPLYAICLLKKVSQSKWMLI